MGSAGSGSGFVIDERGFVITNRHVASNWLTSYHFQDYAFPGVLLAPNKRGELEPNPNYLVSAQDVGNWVPGNEQGCSGINTYLDVTFTNNSQRTPAKIVRISPTHDVAMIKIDLPESLPKVTLYGSYSEIQPGDPAIVLGYPGIAPVQLVLKRSQDVFNNNPNISTVPVPTVSNGNVGRLVRGTDMENRWARWNTWRLNRYRDRKATNVPMFTPLETFFTKCFRVKHPTAAKQITRL